MAIDVDWVTKIIYIPKSYLTLVQSFPTEIRSLDIDLFRHDLKDLEASVVGMIYVDTHRHSPEVTVGGVTLARVVEIINGYTVTFEDGQYAVNLLGANSNIADVTNVNQVSVRSANSAGLVSQRDLENGVQTLQRLTNNPGGRSYGVFGKTIYWDPASGDNDNSGLEHNKPILSWTRALDIAETNGDVIFIINPTGANIVITENINISKANLNLRGAGRSVMFKPTGAQTTPTIRVTAPNVNISGIIVETSSTANSQPCIKVEERASTISCAWIYRGGTNGVEYVAGDYHLLSQCHIEKNNSHGVYFEDAGLSSGSPREVEIERCAIYLNIGDGVRFTANTGAPAHESTRLNSINDSILRNNGGYGLNIGANVWKTLIRGSTGIVANTTGDILDNGDSTEQEINTASGQVIGRVRSTIIPLYSKL